MAVKIIILSLQSGVVNDISIHFLSKDYKGLKVWTPIWGWEEGLNLDCCLYRQLCDDEL